MQKLLTVILLFASVYTSTAQMKPEAASTSANHIPNFPLAGTWILKAAQILLPDGTLITDSAYGQHAKGILMIDSEGQYSLQIFRPDRPKFSSGDKKKGTPEEYESALLGISTHIGHIKIDSAHMILQFKIDYAAFPNWDNSIQTRKFKLSDDELYYEVPAKTANSPVAVSVWKRNKTYN